MKPQIEQLLSSYFTDWQKIEEDVTAIVMKHKGMFTFRLIITSISDDDMDVPQVKDLEVFSMLQIVNASTITATLTSVKNSRIDFWSGLC